MAGPTASALNFKAPGVDGCLDPVHIWEASISNSVRSLLFVMYVLATIQLGGCAEAPIPPLTAEGIVYVLPVGDPTNVDVARAAWVLENATHRLVIRLPTIELHPGLLRADGQIDASQLLDELLLLAPKDTFRIAAITDLPLYAPKIGSIIGYARRGERALAYSTDELPKVATEAAHRRRIRRIIAHELGHTFGAGHCQRECAMRDTHSAHDIDLLSDRFCPTHQAQFISGMQLSLDHPDAIAARSKEYLRLGRWREAIQSFRKLRQLRPRDPQTLTALGVALLANGELLAANEVLVDASIANPRAPQPFYARAVLYAAGYAPNRASAFIEAAVSRDTNLPRAHRAAGVLYEDVLGNLTQAARHFELHIQYGGRNPDVIARLGRLMAPTLIAVEEPELIIPR